MSTNNHESHSSHKSHLSHKSSKSARAARTLTSPKNLPVRLALSQVPKICLCGSHSHKSQKSACAARTLTSPQNLPVWLALSQVPKICPCGSHLAPYHLHKLVKQISSIIRTRRCFRVVLHTKAFFTFDAQTHYSIVI